MPTRTPSPLELEARRSAMHLVDLIQTATVHSPRLVIAIAAVAQAFVEEDQRRHVTQRVAELDATQLAELERALARVERPRGGEGEGAPNGDDVA